MTIKELEWALSRDAYKRIRVLGKIYWALHSGLDVNKLGRVRVVICYNNEA